MFGRGLRSGGSSKSELSDKSLDRIDSKKGYVVGNVQWVHKDINRMKNTFPQDYFIQVCKQIAAKVA